MNATKTLANFEPGARVRMLSGPHNGRTGKRDQYLGTHSKMVLVKFDGDPSFSMVANDDACQSAAEPVPVPASSAPPLPVSSAPDSPSPAKRGRKPKAQPGAQA
jgi:hypothetical protein